MRALLLLLIATSRCWSASQEKAHDLAVSDGVATESRTVSTGPIDPARDATPIEQTGPGSGSDGVALETGPSGSLSLGALATTTSSAPRSSSASITMENITEDALASLLGTAQPVTSTSPVIAPLPTSSQPQTYTPPVAMSSRHAQSHWNAFTLPLFLIALPFAFMIFQGCSTSLQKVKELDHRPTFCELLSLPCPSTEPGVFACQWAWRYVFLVLYVLAVITLVIGLDVRDGGTVSLTLLLASPAVVGFVLGAVHPSPSRFIAVVVLLFVVYMSFFRGYLVRCEHQWRYRCNTHPIAASDGSLGCAGHHFNVTMPLYDYCKDERTLNPEFWFVGSHESCPGFCWLGGSNFNICRMTCWPMTCYFAKGGSPDFQVKAYSLWMFMIAFGLFTLSWMTNCLPLCSCCFMVSDVSGELPLVGSCVGLCCGPGRPPVDLVRTQIHVDRITECGSLPFWLRWLWAAVLPFWLCLYVTYVEGGVQGVMPRIKFDWSVLTVLIGDAKNIAVLLAIVLICLMLYVQRKQLYVALGIDDRYVLHWQNLFGAAAPRHQKVMQLCVWKVKTTYNKGKRHELAPAAEESDETGRQTDLFNSCGRQLSKSKEQHNEMHLDLPQDCAVYVRVAYGHNEPLCGRVVRVPASYHGHREVMFQESFRLNKEDADLEKNEPPLYIELQQQDVASRHDLGRVIIEPARLRTILDTNSKHASQKQLKAMMNFEDEESLTVCPKCGQEAGRKAAKFCTMCGTELPKEPDAESSSLIKSKGGRHASMMAAGFLEEPLSHGGAVWIGIAEIHMES